MIALLAALVLGQVPAAATPAAQLVGATTASERVSELLDDGQLDRFGTADRGPVYVWRPSGYRRATAVTVVYVHGFYTDVDQALFAHQLAAQFRDSGRNALFVVPEARSASGDPIWWPDLEELLGTVEARLHLRRPPGPVVVVGHSGAYRQVALWLKDPRVGQVLLLDGLYGNEDDFRAWVDRRPHPGQPRHQLALVGFETEQRTEWFLARQKVVRLDGLPWLYDELPRATRAAPLLYFQSVRLDHMALITSGRLLPWLLHALR